jgi:MFS family permease
MNGWIETHIPARLDRLPWTAWHWFIVVALGATWILDGLEVTLAGALGGILTRTETLGLTSAQVGASATFYLAGAVLGALAFGYATDRLGRKKLFFVTVGVYLTATALTAFSWNFVSYAFFRALTGAGIGGEYAAINSAIDELIPARLRGRIDLTINGSYWIGAAIGSAGAVVILNPRLFPMDVGWRFVFGIGAVLGLLVMFFRRWIPESPRWLLIHGRGGEAEQIIDEVERHAGVDASNFVTQASSLQQNRQDAYVTDEAARHVDADIPLAPPTRFRARTHTTFREIWETIAYKYRERSLLGFVLMVTQAFFYNAIFFTYALVLMRFYGVAAERVGGYLLPFALGNFLGPLLIGRFFDTIGRKTMIVATYAISGVLLAVAGWMFRENMLTAQTQTIAWTIIFFVASAAASSAYLTVSEIFPLEIRAFAIAVFYSIGTLVGGVFAPLLFGIIIGSGSRDALFAGYLFGAVLMILAAATEAWIGVRAEQRSLESIAAPLSTVG